MICQSLFLYLAPHPKIRNLPHKNPPSPALSTIPTSLSPSLLSSGLLSVCPTPAFLSHLSCFHVEFISSAVLVITPQVCAFPHDNLLCSFFPTLVRFVSSFSHTVTHFSITVCGISCLFWILLTFSHSFFYLLFPFLLFFCYLLHSLFSPLPALLPRLCSTKPISSGRHFL